jgi:pimeloyl-ACP methyl ester carboxylesterase
VKVKIIKKSIPWGHGQTNSFCFLPENKSSSVAIFSHGYTSHKGALLPWAVKLSQIGIATILFDLPGHYLGTFSEVLNFEDFSTNAHHIFNRALDSYIEELNFKEEFKVILGGHSLGSLLALKAASSFNKHQMLLLCVGHGLSQIGEPMVFDSQFFRDTMHIREQLVSPALSPSNVFPWIQKEQQILSLKHQKIILVSGKDDLVVSEKSIMDLKNHLEEKNNLVFLEMANRLPHNAPELASSLIKKLVKEHDFA